MSGNHCDHCTSYVSTWLKSTMFKLDRIFRNKLPFIGLSGGSLFPEVLLRMFFLMSIIFNDTQLAHETYSILVEVIFAWWIDYCFEGLGVGN